MKVVISSTFNLTFEQARELILRPITMQTVASPILRFVAINPKSLPDQWQPGSIYRIKLYSFGFIPLGWYDIKIDIERDDNDLCIGRDRGHGQFINIWDHVISIKRIGDKTYYTDSVDVHAGILTPFVYLFARFFYHHRQRKWRRVIVPGIAKSE